MTWSASNPRANDPAVRRVALIGLGAMGLPIASRLADAGFSLTLFDLDGARLAQAAELGTCAASVREAVQDAAIVLTVLPADRHVESVVEELASCGSPGQVYADLSTIAPTTIERAAERLAASGISTVSVAITRGTAAARSGELTLYVGADARLPATLEPVLAALATDIRDVRSRSAAKALKIANNAVVACLNVAIGEALVIGDAVGISAEAVVRAIHAHAGESWVLRNHTVKSVLAGDVGPGHFSTRNMAKDVALFLDMAGENGRSAPLSGVAAACYRGMIGHGWSEHYHPIVVEWIRMSAGSGQSASARPEAANTIGAAVAAAEALANAEALGALGASGIDARSAAEELARGSAENASLRKVAESVAAGRRSADDAMRDALLGALALADATGVPAFMLEAARHAAAP